LVRGLRWIACIAALAASAHAFQRPFREYPAIEYNDFPLPADYQEKTEWTFARLMYPPAPTARLGRRSRNLRSHRRSSE